MCVSAEVCQVLLSKLGIPECGSQSLLKVLGPSRRKTAPALQGVARPPPSSDRRKKTSPGTAGCGQLRANSCGAAAHFSAPLHVPRCVPVSHLLRLRAEKLLQARPTAGCDVEALPTQQRLHWPWGTSASAPLGPPRKTTPAARSQRCPAWLQKLRVCVWHGVRSFWPLSWI